MQQNNALVAKAETAPAVTGGLFFNVQKFEHAQRVARVFAESTMVPDQFRNNIGNCLIALNYADRLGADPFMLMQGMCVVHGKPGLEGKLIIGIINTSGRYEPLEFEEIGNLSAPTNDNDGCIAWAKDARTGKVYKGPIVDWKTVKAEGWYGKNGSKWKTMAPLMFRYRAAAFFARVYCPDVLLGMQTREELLDVVEMRQTSNGYEVVSDEAPRQTLAERVKAEREAAPSRGEAAHTEGAIREHAAAPNASGPESDIVDAAIEHEDGTVEYPGDKEQAQPTWGKSPEDRLGDEPRKATLKRLHREVTARGYDKKGVKLAMRRWEIHRVGEKVRRPFDVDSTDDILVGDVGLWGKMLDDLKTQHDLLMMIGVKEKQIPGFGDIVKQALSEAEHPINAEHWYLLTNSQAARAIKSLDDIALGALEGGKEEVPL